MRSSRPVAGEVGRPRSAARRCVACSTLPPGREPVEATFWLLDGAGFARQAEPPQPRWIRPGDARRRRTGGCRGSRRGPLPHTRTRCSHARRTRGLAPVPRPRPLRLDRAALDGQHPPVRAGGPRLRSQRPPRGAGGARRAAWVVPPTGSRRHRLRAVLRAGDEGDRRARRRPRRARSGGAAGSPRSFRCSPSTASRDGHRHVGAPRLGRTRPPDARTFRGRTAGRRHFDAGSEHEPDPRAFGRPSRILRR